MLSNAGRVVNKIVGGWELSFIVTAQGGFPFTAAMSGDVNGDGTHRSPRPGRPGVIQHPQPVTATLSTAAIRLQYLRQRFCEPACRSPPLWLGRHRYPLRAQAFGHRQSRENVPAGTAGHDQHGCGRAHALTASRTGALAFTSTATTAAGSCSRAARVSSARLISNVARNSTPAITQVSTMDEPP